MGLLEAAQQKPPTSREDPISSNDSGFLAQLQKNQTPKDHNKETIEEKKRLWLQRTCKQTHRLRSYHKRLHLRNR